MCWVFVFIKWLPPPLPTAEILTLVISDWNSFCEDDAPRLRSSWIRPRVRVMIWHSNSRCSLLVFLSLVPSCFLCFWFGSSRTAWHLFVRALPNSSIRIHCILFVAWEVRVTVGFLIEVEFFCNISFITWVMFFAQSSSSHPSSTRSTHFSPFVSSRDARVVQILS